MSLKRPQLLALAVLLVLCGSLANEASATKPSARQPAGTRSVRIDLQRGGNVRGVIVVTALARGTRVPVRFVTTHLHLPSSLRRQAKRLEFTAAILCGGRIGPFVKARRPSLRGTASRLPIRKVVLRSRCKTRYRLGVFARVRAVAGRSHVVLLSASGSIPQLPRRATLRGRK
jgi:hypothetical protein